MMLDPSRLLAGGIDNIEAHMSSPREAPVVPVKSRECLFFDAIPFLVLCTQARQGGVVLVLVRVLTRWNKSPAFGLSISGQVTRMRLHPF